MHVRKRERGAGRSEKRREVRRILRLSRKKRGEVPWHNAYVPSAGVKAMCSRTPVRQCQQQARACALYAYQ